MSWRDLQPGTSMDAYIAAELGWTDLRVTAEYGNQIMLLGRWPGNFQKEVTVPQYSRDANCSLPMGNEVMEIDLNADAARARMSPCTEWEYGKNLAEARTRAWLAAKEKQDDVPAGQQGSGERA